VFVAVEGAFTAGFTIEKRLESPYLISRSRLLISSSSDSLPKTVCRFPKPVLLVTVSPKLGLYTLLRPH
jgi:hypothetical protein